MRERLILIVENEPILVDLYKLMLEFLFFDSLAVKSSVEAHAALKKMHHCMAVITRLNFSYREDGNEGIELCLELRKAYPQLPTFIIATGLLGRCLLETIRNSSHANDVLVSPFKLEDLRLVLEKHGIS